MPSVTVEQMAYATVVLKLVFNHLEITKILTFEVLLLIKTKRQTLSPSADAQDVV